MHTTQHVRAAIFHRPDQKVIILLVWLAIVCQHNGTEAQQHSKTTTSLNCVWWNPDGSCWEPTPIIIPGTSVLSSTASPYNVTTTLQVTPWWDRPSYTPDPVHVGINSAVIAVPIATVLIVIVIVGITRVLQCRNDALIRAQESSSSADCDLADAENQINQYRSYGRSNAPPTYTESLMRDILRTEDETTPTVTTDLQTAPPKDELPTYSEIMSAEPYRN